MLDKLRSSIFDEGNVIFMFFGSTLSNDDSDLFLPLDFSGESVSVVSPPSVFFVIYIFFAHSVIFYNFFNNIHYQNFARGSPLFSSFSCLRQNQNQHKIIRGEHPAGACCLGSNGQTTATTHTNPVRQLSAGMGTGQYGRHLNQG